ncbi:hypothetical protein MTO96_043305 [Rhipicephalus appendiculatus]
MKQCCKTVWSTEESSHSYVGGRGPFEGIERTLCIDGLSRNVDIRMSYSGKQRRLLTRLNSFYQEVEGTCQGRHGSSRAA